MYKDQQEGPSCGVWVFICSLYNIIRERSDRRFKISWRSRLEEMGALAGYCDI